MEGTVILVVFLAVICGGMTLMLAAGYQSVEKDRERRVSPERTESVVNAKSLSAVPSFFVTPDASIPSMSFALHDTLVRQLEQHVRIEQAVVAQFVHHPSVDSLYRATGPSLHVH
jgi:hypothetical protein